MDLEKALVNYGSGTNKPNLRTSAMGQLVLTVSLSSVCFMEINPLKGVIEYL